MDTGGTWYDFEVSPASPSGSAIKVSFNNCKRTLLSASISGKVEILSPVSGTYHVSTQLPLPNSEAGKTINSNCIVYVFPGGSGKSVSYFKIYSTTTLSTGTIVDFSDLLYYIKQ